MKMILVMTDFSKRSSHAAEVAMTIAQKTNSELLLFHAFYLPAVVPADSVSYFYENNSTIEEETLKKLKDFAEKLNKKQASKEGDHKVHIRFSQQSFTSGRDINKAITRKNIWLIVMGDKSRKGGLNDIIFGSMATDVIENATCLVLLISQKVTLEGGFKIAFASNMESSNIKALHKLIEFASIFDSEIVVIHVCSSKLSAEEMTKNLNYLEKLRSKLTYTNITYEELEGEEVPETLQKFSRIRNIGILAMVHKQYSFFKRLFHSSTTKSMMDYHKIPLIVLPARS